MHRLVNAVYKRVASAIAVFGGRRLSRRRILKIKPKRILVLCYGNIYRSPFSARVLQENLNTVSDAYEVRSAGFHEKSGRPSVPEYVELCAKFNVDLKAHRSTVVNSELIDWADILVIMDRHNWGRLMDIRPSGLTKLIWIGSGEERGSVEIEDPYKKDERVILNIVTRLASASVKLAELIRGA